MIHLEKQTKNIAKQFLYEGNTPYLRQKFVDTITPIFENAKNGNGIIDYIIKCDETNNTPTTIDRNEMHCTIAVKPVKTVEWIICNFIVTDQSANI
jgi:phage tail sheath protein FI